MSHFQHAMPFGCRLDSAGVRFRLWAPKARQANLMLCSPPHGVIAMNQSEPGWFECFCRQAGAGSLYRFEVDGVAVPDPASRFQPCDAEGPSEVIDPLAWRWRHARWRGRPWHETVIYEMHVGAFTKQGRFQDVENQLDRLVSLGVSAIELMPVADFPGQFNWGYDGVLWYAPDHRYGRPEHLKSLIDKAHGKGLMVFLDVVYNHFGPQGNYFPKYAPVHRRGKYTPWGPALNFSGKHSHWVRRWVVENVLYWLVEYRFDGLRLDAVQAFQDDSKQHLLWEIEQAVAALRRRRYIHLILENDDNEPGYLDGGANRAYNAQWNDDFHHVCHVLTTGEQYGYYRDFKQGDLHALGKALTEGFVYQGEVSSYRGAARGKPSAHLPATAFVQCLQNHDQVGNRIRAQRFHQFVHSGDVESFTALLLLTPGIPMLFMGQEWCAEETFDFFADFSELFARPAHHGRIRELAHLTGLSASLVRRHVKAPGADNTFESTRLTAPLTYRQRRFYRLVRQWLRYRRRTVQPLLRKPLKASYRVRGDRLQVQWCRAGTRLLLGLARKRFKPPVTGNKIRVLFSNVDAASGGHRRWRIWLAVERRAA